ncbi:hypothetical protein [Dokdonella soli]|uniref:Uncharacterized protein n=1 Tax=Dokdonella soli TaxID=529810 RepID=A0ABN1ID73_9GAMM
MSDAYRRLNETLLERRAPAAGAFASDARALRSWIDALPMANYAVAAKRLLDGLRDLNRQRLQGAQRLEALESLRAPVIQLAAATDKQIVGASFPLPPSKAELGELALGFQDELAAGYRAALAELCSPNGTVPFLRSKQVILAAVRALQHGDEHLAKAYLLYRTPPAGAWKALHAVHAFIASLRLDDRAAADPLNGSDANARVAYVHALLLALANPYRYTQREQGEVITLTRRLAPYCELRDGSGSEQDVLIDQEADRGPGYLPEERANGQRDVRVLRLDAMHAFVDEQLAGAAPSARTATFRMRGGSALHVDIDLARRLAAGWSARSERGHARLGGGYVLDSVLGLHDLHFVLAGGDSFETFMQRVSGQAISLSGADHGASWRIGASDPGRAARLPARVLDQSLGGYRVLWERGPSGESVHARVAELVGLALPERSADVTADWMIGVIRWIRIDEQGRVDAGVELLARRALPVGVRALDGASGHGSLRGLLLAPLAGTGIDYDALLAPTEIDRHANEIELTLPADLHGPPALARTERATDLRMREATGIYQHFALAPRASAPTDLVEPALVLDP